MIKVSNGHILLEVTPGAFRNYYQRQGFRALDGLDGPNAPNGENTRGEGDSPVSASPRGCEGISTEEVMEMNTKQLMELADTLGLGSRNVRTKGELRDMILRTLE